ncbi:MAG: DUF1223 domain-containing protein [Sphingobacteriales bacterium]|nr:MAG: DUF1223 domain-containing protein [Sphingobacteriales bacterium]
MKTTNLLIINYLSFTLLSLSSCSAQTTKATGSGFAVVELFTSEGCSSCPKADALMPVLKNEFKSQVYVLSFHVDYWNRLGWKDQFSSSAYSNRQYKYAAVFRLQSVYTPQAVVNGSHQITGSDKAGLQHIIGSELGVTSPQKLQVVARAVGTSGCSVTYNVPLKDNEELNIALVQLQATTQVEAGENEGRTIKHENVVRRFETVENSKGIVNFNLPDDLRLSQCHVIVYIQQKDNMKITSVTELNID